MAPNETMVDYDQPTSIGEILITELKCKEMIYWNKNNNSTRFIFSVVFSNCKRGDVEISPVSSCYDKNQLLSLTSTQLVLFDEVHTKQFRGPPTTIQNNEYKVFSKRWRK